MIFLTVGTQDKQFLRLLKIVDNAIEKGIVKEEVIAQIGCNKFKSKNIKTAIINTPIMIIMILVFLSSSIFIYLLYFSIT